MRYKPEEVEGIRRSCQDPEECCMNMFIDWLTTLHGPTLKTYQTLLKHIKKIDGLTAASEAIEEALIKGNSKLKANSITECTINYLFFVTALRQ